MTRKLVQVVALAVLLLASPADAGQKVGGGLAREDSGVSFDCEMPLQELPKTGFFPFRLRIDNRTGDSHTWELSFSTGGGGGPEGRMMRWSTSLTVASGQSREWDLLVPRAILENGGSSYEFVRAELRGYGLRGDGVFSLPSRYVSGAKTAFVAMSDSLASAAWSKLEAEVRSTTPSPTKNPTPTSHRFSSTGRGSRALSGSSVILTELPPDWRAFSGFGGLWLTQRDWERLNSERRRAIRTWIGLGGHLFIGTDSGALEKAALLPESLQAGKAVQLGLGEVKSFKLEGGEIPLAQTARDVLELDGAVFPAWFRDFNTGWRLTETVGRPQLNVPLIIGFVCIFGLVIGPINLRLLAPPQKRHRLFLTVPLLSLGASVLLGVVIAVGDGFGGFGGRNALVYLAAGENQALIAQEQIARTRLLLGRSFGFPETAQLAAADTKGLDGSVTLQRIGNAASGDWFKSRAVQTHVIRAAVPTRAEVVLQSPAADGSPVLLSSIGAPIRDVFYIDPNGDYWRADTMETGRPTPLKATSKEELDRWQVQVNVQLSDHLKAALDNAIHRRGNFYAVTTSLPEAPLPTLTSINWEKQTIVCFGPCTKGGAQ